MKTICPTCGSQVQTTNGTTNHFISIDLDQEKEKVAVAFAEWKDNNVFGFGYYSISNSREYMFFQSMPDLYQHFITNVYNK